MVYREKDVNSKNLLYPIIYHKKQEDITTCFSFKKWYIIYMGGEMFMKKIGIILFASLLLVVGCTSKESGTLTCTRTAKQGNIEVSLNYKIAYTGEYVNTIETTEIVKSEDQNTLNLYKTQLENVYDPYKSIDYYENEVTIEGDTLTSKTKIDYEHINVDDLIEIDSANEQILKDGKARVSDFRSMYESIGASCK